MSASDKTFYVGKKKYNCTKNGKPYYRKTVTINGKRHSFFGDGEKDCLRKIEDAKRDAAKGLDFEKRSSKVDTVFEYWLYNVKRVDIKIKASSFDRYETVYRLHIKPYPISTVILSRLESATLQQYITDLYEKENMGYASLQHIAKVWKMFVSWAMDEGYITKNLTKNLSLPGKREIGRKVIEVFTPEERSLMLSYMDTSAYQYDTLIKLAFATGMRQGELIGLMWKDVHETYISVERSTAMVYHIDNEGNRDRYREVWDTKTENSVRDIPILPETYDMLMQHKLDQKLFFEDTRTSVPEYVFTTDTGQLIDSSSLTKSYKRMLARAGIPERKFHAIRHTFATEALRRGVNIKDLQHLMGHADIETTYQYVHSDIASKAKAIEKMGRIM